MLWDLQSPPAIAREASLDVMGMDQQLRHQQEHAEETIDHTNNIVEFLHLPILHGPDSLSFADRSATTCSSPRKPPHRISCPPCAQISMETPPQNWSIVRAHAQCTCTRHDERMEWYAPPLMPKLSAIHKSRSAFLSGSADMDHPKSPFVLEIDFDIDDCGEKSPKRFALKPRLRMS